MISKYIFILGLFWHTNFIGISVLFFEGHCPIPQMQKRTQRKGGRKINRFQINSPKSSLGTQLCLEPAKAQHRLVPKKSSKCNIRLGRS